GAHSETDVEHPPSQWPDPVPLADPLDTTPLPADAPEAPASEGVPEKAEQPADADAPEAPAAAVVPGEDEQPAVEGETSDEQPAPPAPESGDASAPEQDEAPPATES